MKEKIVMAFIATAMTLSLAACGNEDTDLKDGVGVTGGAEESTVEEEETLQPTASQETEDSALSEEEKADIDGAIEPEVKTINIPELKYGDIDWGQVAYFIEEGNGMSAEYVCDARILGFYIDFNLDTDNYPNGYSVEQCIALHERYRNYTIDENGGAVYTARTLPEHTLQLLNLVSEMTEDEWNQLMPELIYWNDVYSDINYEIYKEWESSDRKAAADREHMEMICELYGINPDELDPSAPLNEQGRLPDISDYMSAQNEAEYNEAAFAEENGMTMEQYNAVKPVIQSIAQKAMATGTTDLDHVRAASKALYEYVQSGTYGYEGSYNTPYGLIIEGNYSCSGTAHAMAMVLTEMGYPVEYYNAHQWNHQWVTTTLDGQAGWAECMGGIADYGDYPFPCNNPDGTYTDPETGTVWQLGGYNG